VNFPLFSFAQSIGSLWQAVNRRFRQWTKPINDTMVLSTTLDLTRSRLELMLENALLRQQLIVLKRQIKRPKLTWRDRALFVLLASKLRTWKNALIIVQPDTVLRWHRELFRRVWKRRSRSRGKRGRPVLTGEIVALIKRLAKENLRWGAERIRGELLKLGIRVSKSAIQKYIQQVRGPNLSSQNWATFLRNHASQIWACDFLQTYDIFFRTIFVFVIIELGSRRVVHFRVTRNPTDRWVAQQWRKVLKTPFRAPKANAICEWFLGSLRRECLDHVLILSERHLHQIVKEYTEYFNAIPHKLLRTVERWQRFPSPFQLIELCPRSFCGTSMKSEPGTVLANSLPLLRKLIRVNV
jgi:putative transposase